MPARLLGPRETSLPNWYREASVAPSREDVIAEYVVGGSVLDLGVVDSRRALEPTAQRLGEFAASLHEYIRRLNADVLGVDIDAEGIAILKGRGYNVICADVETMALGRRFDTIVAGEIIEHLCNPGRALVTLREHLKPSGRLILTTCNPFYINQFWKIWKYDAVQVHEEHTAWFDPWTLGRLLDLSGYTVDRLCWVQVKRRHGRWRIWPIRLRSYFHSNFLMVARRKEDKENQPEPPTAPGSTRGQSRAAGCHV